MQNFYSEKKSHSLFGVFSKSIGPHLIIGSYVKDKKPLNFERFSCTMLKNVWLPHTGALADVIWT